MLELLALFLLVALAIPILLVTVLFKVAFKLVLLPFKLLLLPIIIIAVIVKLAVVLAVGATAVWAQNAAGVAARKDTMKGFGKAVRDKLLTTLRRTSAGPAA